MDEAVFLLIEIPGVAGDEGEAVFQSDRGLEGIRQFPALRGTEIGGPIRDGAIDGEGREGVQ